MRRVWMALRIAGIGLIGAVGCAETPKRSMLKAPKETFHIPAPGTFAEPTKYPAETLNRVPLRKQTDEDKLPPLGPGGGGPSSGGMSMGNRP